MINALSKAFLRLGNRHFIILDAIVFLITPALALALRLDHFLILDFYGIDVISVTILFLTVKLSVLYGFGFYRRYWRYASIDELTQITMLMSAAVILQTLMFYLLHYWNDYPEKNLPRSLPLLDGILSLILVGGLRFSVRAIERVSQRRIAPSSRGEHVIIAGAGDAGVSIVQQMQQNPQLGFYPVAFIDDAPGKLNLRIRGLPVVGNRYKIPEVVPALNIHRVIIAMPTVSGRVIREIVDICQSIGVKTSTLPGIHEIINGRVGVESIREVKIEDLLRREPIQTDVEGVSRFLMGKKVLITGAGGSIGSELCRQILKCRPAEMILLGHGENSVFNIQQELEGVLKVLREDETQGHVPRIATFIADIRFSSRLEYCFKQFRPEIIFHAAAHKHVPLMELNSPEAITNNVLGTKNLLDLALRYDVGHFVMISTDKAVNPTNVMGASKRSAEMLVLRAAQKSRKPFVVVRFGNVLGSRGSVVPTFQRQIAAGGPVTITDPEICRYFMTIPEAVQLVLQASVIGRGGEVFMLNMGQPVKIVDLAKDLIRLSGYEVGKDIDILFTGLRPGEKLFEELFIPGEQYEPTQHEKIITVRNASKIIPENLEPIVEALCEAARKNDYNLLVFLLKKLVSEYTPGNLHANFTALTLQENTYTEIYGSEPKRGLSEALDISMYTHTVAPLQVGNDLRQALEFQAFQIHYQPIVSLQTNRIIGFEALLRWQHPQRGLVACAEFMPVVEETGLIIPIGWWVIHEACRQMGAWQEQFPVAPPLTISVNLSGRQFVQPDLIKQIEQILQKTELDACSLKLEIAESVVIENPDAATTTLLQLRALGVQLQIDQLGIGYSFLSRIQRLPNLICYQKFDTLKVDRSLISQIDIDNESLEIFQKIVVSAKDLGMDMTAAGVETAEQLAKLKALKCEYGQGYLFSKSVEGEVARTLIGRSYSTKVGSQNF